MSEHPFTPTAKGNCIACHESERAHAPVTAPTDDGLRAALERIDLAVDAADGISDDWTRGARWVLERFRAALSAAPAPLGFDPTNHHNAAKCPYCTKATPQRPDGDETELEKRAAWGDR